MLYKSSVLAVALLVTSISSVGASEIKKNYVGPTVSFISGVTAVGATSKFGVSDNLSVRPFIEFAGASGGGASASATLFGATVTYDFDVPKTPIAPYAGVGYLIGTATASAGGASASGTASSVYFEIGSDFNLSDSIALNANYKFRDAGFFSIGAGYRF